jgi:hypothetical protein
MMWKGIIATCAVVFVVTLAVWFSQGSNVFTKDRELVVTEKLDPLFGTTVRSTEYVPRFQLGLLPGGTSPQDVPGSVAFIGGTSIALVLFSLWKIKKQQKA